jgi:hypothetical protein
MRALLTALALVVCTASSAFACSWGNKSTTAELDTDKDREQTTASVEKTESASTERQGWSFDSNSDMTLADSTQKDSPADN